MTAARMNVRLPIGCATRLPAPLAPARRRAPCGTTPPTPHSVLLLPLLLPPVFSALLLPLLPPLLPLLLSPLLPLTSQPANYFEACAQPTAKHLGLHGHAGPVNGFEAGTLFIEVDAVATEAVSSKMLGPAAAAPEPAAAVAGFDPEPTCAAASQGPKLSSAISKPLAAPAEATKAGVVGAKTMSGLEGRTRRTPWLSGGLVRPRPTRIDAG